VTITSFIVAGTTFFMNFQMSIDYSTNILSFSVNPTGPNPTGSFVGLPNEQSSSSAWVVIVLAVVAVAAIGGIATKVVLKKKKEAARLNDALADSHRALV